MVFKIVPAHQTVLLAQSSPPMAASAGFAPKKAPSQPKSGARPLPPTASGVVPKKRDVGRDVLDFEQRFAGKPIDFDSLTRIIPMTPTLYQPAQLRAYFEKHRQPNQRGIAVIVKSERCCANEFRPCAVTTAVFEKSHPELMTFMAYVKQPVAGPKSPWEDAVLSEYEFRDGPGATIVLLDPQSPARLRTDAGAERLIRAELIAKKGETPVLDATISGALDSFAKQARLRQAVLEWQAAQLPRQTGQVARQS